MGLASRALRWLQAVGWVAVVTGLGYMILRWRGLLH